MIYYRYIDSDIYNRYCESSSNLFTFIKRLSAQQKPWILCCVIAGTPTVCDAGPKMWTASGQLPLFAGYSSLFITFKTHFVLCTMYYFYDIRAAYTHILIRSTYPSPKSIIASYYLHSLTNIIYRCRYIIIAG